MSVAEAKRVYLPVTSPLVTRAEVEIWLQAKGIAKHTGFMPTDVSYSVAHRPNDPKWQDHWMGSLGDKTFAELAGVPNRAVYSMIKVTYPDASRSLFCVTEVSVRIFFDENDQKISSWIQEFHSMP
jgi:hypothetical protein